LTGTQRLVIEAIMSAAHSFELAPQEFERNGYAYDPSIIVATVGTRRASHLVSGRGASPT